MTIRTREDIKKMVNLVMKPPKKPKKKEQDQIFDLKKKKDMEVKKRKIKIKRRKILNRTSRYQANI